VRKDGESLARKKFEQAKKGKDLEADVDAAALARYVATLLQGLCVQAATGATKAEMTRVVDTALLYMGYQDDRNVEGVKGFRLAKLNEPESPKIQKRPRKKNHRQRGSFAR
jgi:hypothetical protein